MGKLLRSNTEKKLASSASDSASPESDLPIEPLSGDRFCDFIVFTDTRLNFPRKMNSVLPDNTVPAVITYGEKTWKTTLRGEKRPMFLDHDTYKEFLDGCKIKNGDGLILEVIENSEELVKFKAQILRADFPDELDTLAGGDTIENAIDVD